MKSLLERMESRYGDEWFYHQPPGALPVVSIESFQPDTFGLGAKTKTNEITVMDSFLLIIESYSIRIFAEVQNPWWPGIWVIELPDASFQGFLSWKPIIENSSGMYHSKSALDFIITHGPGPDIPAEHDGFSIFHEFAWPRMLAQPGQSFSLQTTFYDNDGGIARPPGPFTSWYLVSEVRGYFLAIPNAVKGEMREQRVERQSQSFINMLQDSLAKLMPIQRGPRP